MDIRIRPATPVDQPDLARMIGGLHAYFHAIDTGVDEDTARAAHEHDVEETAGLAFLPEPFCHCVIAEADGASIGYLAYHFGVFEGRGALFVAGLYVDRAGRGKGVGEALMGEAERIAASRGAKSLVWTVWTENAPAFRFYERLGAAIYKDDVILWKRLD